MHLSGDVTEHVLQHSTLGSAVGRSNCAWSSLIRNVLKNGSVFVQDGSIIEDQSRNVSLGIDGVEVNT